MSTTRTPNLTRGAPCPRRQHITCYATEPSKLSMPRITRSTSIYGRDHCNVSCMQAQYFLSRQREHAAGTDEIKAMMNASNYPIARRICMYCGLYDQPNSTLPVSLQTSMPPRPRQPPLPVPQCSPDAQPQSKHTGHSSYMQAVHITVRPLHALMTCV